MLLKQRVLQGIAQGRITLAFRRWKRPTVKAGGRLRTAIGVLAIESVDVVAEDRISKRDALCAGYTSREELLAYLAARKEGKTYRIALRYVGNDPRRQLREQDDMTDEELDDLKARLARLDARSRQGPWTAGTLAAIASSPGRRAAELAEATGMETARFKANVRKLKELGLTESLEVGYRLSPRGEVVFRRMRI